MSGLIAPDGSEAFTALERVWIGTGDIQVFTGRLAPIRDRVVPVSEHVAIDDRTTTIPTPGHTVCEVRSGVGSLLVWGDTVHVPTLQFDQAGVLRVEEFAIRGGRAKRFEFTAAQGRMFGVIRGQVDFDEHGQRAGMLQWSRGLPEPAQADLEHPHGGPLVGFEIAQDAGVVQHPGQPAQFAGSAVLDIRLVVLDVYHRVACRIDKRETCLAGTESGDPRRPATGNTAVSLSQPRTELHMPQLGILDHHQTAHMR